VKRLCVCARTCACARLCVAVLEGGWGCVCAIWGAWVELRAPNMDPLAACDLAAPIAWDPSCTTPCPLYCRRSLKMRDPFQVTDACLESMANGSVAASLEDLDISGSPW
jgi:hypothetical protein